MPLWNLHFLNSGDRQQVERSFDVRDWFGEVEGHLFYSIISRPLGTTCEPRLPRNHSYPFVESLTWAKVAPISSEVVLVTASTQSTGSTSWHTDVNFLPEMECYFIDFFEWNSTKYRTYRLVRCELRLPSESDKRKSVDALVEFDSIRILLNREV